MAAKKIAKTTPHSPPNEAAVTPKPVAKKAARKPSLDTVARGAYLNYRNRVEKGLPGDSQGDWLEAERQYAELG